MPLGTQIAVRLDDEVLDRLDELISQGRFDSRAQAVRQAIRWMLEAERRRAVGEAIIDGYRRIPQTDEELARAEANVRRLIDEEPW